MFVVSFSALNGDIMTRTFLAVAAIALAAAPAFAGHGRHPGYPTTPPSPPSTSSSGGATPVPEPTDAVLVLMGAAGVVIGRRFHARAKRG
jgi:hypothetical protein